MKKKTDEIIDKLYYEKMLLDKGYKYIAGVDEVGRGPLAGEVVTASVIMDLERIVEGIDDSKKLSEKKREKLYEDIINSAIAYSINKVSPKVIDEINILNATKMCMVESIKGLSIKPDIVLVDAVKLDIDIPTMPIIKGDALSYSIGSASILAKVYRDRLMVEYSKLYPQYMFEKHKGYGTKAHIDAIKEYGACPIHRATFIKNFV